MSEPVESFPFARLDEIRRRPADFRLLERVPLTLAGIADYLPLQLNEPVDHERVHQAIFLDTETTGTNYDRDKIMELGMVRATYSFDRRLILSVDAIYDELEDPLRPIPEEIQKITHITNEMVAGHKINQEKVASWLNDKPLVIAHNAAFDRPFFENRFPELDKFSWACSLKGVDWDAFGHSGSKLEHLLLCRGWFYEAHRASTDCLALLWLMYTEPGAFGMLIDSALKPSFRLLAKGSPFEIKDTLKQNGYKWDAPARVWYRNCESREDAEQSLQELRGLYDARNAVIEESNASTRFKHK